MSALDVVVPVHGAWAHVERCLAAVCADERPHQLIVVDDASPDATASLVASRFSSACLLRNPRNLGFAAAVNRGVEAGEGEVVVVLNSDVEIAPGFLGALAGAFADPLVGAAAPLLLRPDGRVDALGIAVDRTLAGYTRGHGSAVGAAPPGGLLGPYGAAAAYRREAWEALGGFDERIFMYHEELDLALRLRAAGWRAVEVPDARGLHAGAASVGLGTSEQRFRAAFGRGYLLRRYGVLRGRAAPAALSLEAAAVAGDLLASRDLAAARGRWAGWRAARGLPRRAAPEVGSIALGHREAVRRRVAVLRA